MATKIIKKGTARAAIVQQFSYSETAAKTAQRVEQTEWIEFPPVPFDESGRTSLETGMEGSVPDLIAREKAAFEKGLAQGEKSAMEIAERKIDAAIKRYGESIGEIRKLRSTLHAQVEREVVKLAIAVAKKVVHREISVDRDIVQTLVHVALSRVAEKSGVTLCLNPEDYSYLLERKAELGQSEGRDIALLADKSIERGGCLIQTNCGDIDARIEEQFREVERAFFEGTH